MKIPDPPFDPSQSTADQCAVRAVEIINELKTLRLTRAALRHVSRSILEPVKRHYSPEAITRISEAQKRRWRDYRVRQSSILADEATPAAGDLVKFIGPITSDLGLECGCRTREAVVLCAEAKKLWQEHNRVRNGFEEGSNSLIDLVNALRAFRNHFKLQQEESTVKVSSLFMRPSAPTPRPDKAGVPVSSQPPAQPAPKDPNGDLPLEQIIRHERGITVGSALASRILAELRYEHQRPSKRNRLQTRIEEMRHGGFHDDGQLSFARFQDRLILVNGYTRLEAIIQTGKTYRFIPQIRDCSEWGEVAAFYGEFDQGVSIRTIRERFGGYYVPNELRAKEEEALATAVVCIATHLELPEATQHAYLLNCPEQRGQLIEDWRDIAAKYFRQIVAEAPYSRKSLFRRAAILAPALLILKHCPEKGTEFFSEAALDNRLPRGDPRKAMLLRLEPRALRVKGKSFARDVRVVATCWNAFATGQTVNQVQVRMDRPVELFGVHKNKKHA